MHQEAEGREILGELMIDRFMAPEDSWYEPVKEIYRQVLSNPLNRHDETEKS